MSLFGIILFIIPPKNQITVNRISFESVDFYYNKNTHLFRNLNFSLGTDMSSGYITALMGSSGAGKTTFLKLLNGLIKPQNGAIKLSSQNSILSYVPQEPVLFDHFSPYDNARYFEFSSIYKNRFDKKLFEHLTDVLEMSDILLKRKNISELSGGQKQRLSLLRALSIRPQILLLDEPCTGLDAEVKFSFLVKLLELTKKLNIFSIYVTHHIDEAKFIADDIAFLNKNRSLGIIDNISVQKVDDFLTSPPSLDAYRISKFPALNIFPIEFGPDGKAFLSNSSTNYVCIEKPILSTEDDPLSLPFKVVFANSDFVTLEDEQTNTFMSYNNLNLKNEKYLFLNLNGKHLSYDSTGILTGFKNIVFK